MNKEKLNNIIDKTDSTWKERAKFRIERPWLMHYSSQIARRILALIEDDEELNQKKLAQTLDIKAQQISKIVQGKENLTLETIYKLSKALDFELISFPEYKYSVAQPDFILFGEATRQLVTANNLVKSPNECLDSFSKENQKETATPTGSTTTTDGFTKSLHKLSSAA